MKSVLKSVKTICRHIIAGKKKVNRMNDKSFRYCASLLWLIVTYD